MKNFPSWAGWALIGLAAYVSIVGINSMSHGSVSGGNSIWVLLFGGATCLAMIGAKIIRRAKS